MMLKLFDLKTVISIQKQYATTGHSPYLVLTDNFEQYILKSPLNLNDKSSIVREFLCNQLLKIWQIKTPQGACLKLSAFLLSSYYVQQNQSLKKNKTFYGSLFVPNSIDLNQFFDVASKVDQRKIVNIETLLDIALFDIWVENDDRKPSNNNIILHPIEKHYQILPIDNAFTFATMNFEFLNPEYVSFSDNDSILHSSVGLSAISLAMKNKNWVSIAENKFYLCIEFTKKSFQQICDTLPEEYNLSSEECECLKTFLFSQERNKKVFEQFKYIVSTAIK